MDSRRGKLFRLTGRRDVERDLADELDHHLALAEEEALAAGADPAEARGAAERELGDRGRLLDEMRTIAAASRRANRRTERMGRWLLEIRRAWRSIRRDRWFALAAFSMVAVAVAANLGMFSVLNAAFWRALPYPDAERIVSVRESYDGRPLAVAGANFRDWHREATSFAALAAHTSWSGTLVRADRADQVGVAIVTRDFAAVMGVAPAVGRWFADEETRENGAPATVISDRLWRARFGMAADVVGSTIEVDGYHLTVVGVMPAALQYPSGAELWIPAELFGDSESRTAHNWKVVGRLAEGVDAAAATRSLSDLTVRITSSEPATEYLANGALVRSLRSELLGQSPSVLLVLQAAVALLLLIAVLNLTALQLARASKRRGETVMITALGAGRMDLVRRSVAEALVLAVVGTGLGVAAWVGVRSRVVPVLGEALPFVGTLPLDLRVIGFLAALIAVVCLVAGLVPAWWAARTAQSDGVAARGRTVGPGLTMRSLMSVEVAATYVLLAGAALLGKSLGRMLDQPLGFELDNRVVVAVDLPSQPGSPFRDRERNAAFFEQLAGQAAALPSVRRVAFGTAAPLLGRSPDGRARIAGTPSESNVDGVIADFRVASPGFFSVLGVPLVAGREFEATDRAESPYVAVVNESFVRRFLPGAEPLGQRVKFGGMDWVDEDRWATVVGVVGDVRQRGPGDDPVPAVYYDYAQRPQPGRTGQLIVEHAGPAPVVLDGLRGLLGREAPMVPFLGGPLADGLESAVAGPRLRTAVLTGFAIAALVLAAVGLFGVVGFAVAQRTRELGLRIALGATAGGVVRAAIGPSLLAVALGLVMGVGASAVLGRLAGGLLFEVSSLDAAALAAAAVLLGGAALVACLGPVRRALAIDPSRALREE
ncbi:MAG: ADOP family duplicated permease [Gemmatimonadales bacterium]